MLHQPAIDQLPHHHFAQALDIHRAAMGEVLESAFELAEAIA